MSARQTLFDELPVLQEAVDSPVLVDGSVPPRIESMFKAGISLACFIAVEHFILARGKELTNYVSKGSGRFEDLHNRSQKLVIRRSVDVLESDLRSTWMDDSERLASAAEIGHAFSKLGAPTLQMARHALRWSGSNVQERDLEECFMIMGLEGSPWTDLNMVLKRALRLDSIEQVRSMFSQLASARHRAAHELDPNVSITVLRSLPGAVARCCLAIDVLLSHLAHRLFLGEHSQLSNPHTCVSFIYVEPKKNSAQWRRKKEANTQGRLSDSFDDAWTAAMSDSAALSASVVATDENGEPLRWGCSFCP